MGAWIRRQRSWLVVERLPGPAPEVNPVEGLWSNLKALELANLTGSALAEVIAQAHLGIERVRQTPHLARLFLRHTALSLVVGVTALVGYLRADGAERRARAAALVAAAANLPQGAQDASRTSTCIHYRSTAPISP